MPRSATIVFDMDDVIAKMRDPVSAILDKMSGKIVPLDQWHTLCTHALYDIPFCVDTMVRERLIERCEPEADAQSAMQALRDNGFRIAIATARGWHPDGVSLTEAWLDHFRLPFDELHVVDLGSAPSKSAVFDRIARHQTIHAFIDDQPRYLQQADDHIKVQQVIVMDRPWNRDAIFPRVTSLTEFAQRMRR